MWQELYIEYEGSTRPPFRRVNTDAMVALSVLNWASLGTLGAVAIAGLIEGQLSFRPTRRVRRRRQVPEDILRDLEILASPTGVGIRGHF